MHCIEVVNLRKEYRSYRKAAGLWQSLRGLVAREHVTVQAVRDVSFTIEAGEIVGFLGPNGAGKTTTLKMLAGIIYPTNGTATVLGYTPWERRREFQRQFSIVMGQKNQLWWDLPPADSYQLFREIYAIPDRTYRRRLAELVELLDVASVITIPTRKLSLGQRMKCELIGALLHAPKVLFLDEPTIGLDLISQANIREFIRAHNERERTTIMLTSHYMEDVKALAKRVIIMDHGQIVYDDSLDALTRTYGDVKSVTLTFSETVRQTALARFGTVTEWSPTRATLDVPRTESAKVAAALLTKFPVDDIDISTTEADDVIRAMFAKSVGKERQHG